MELIQKGYSCDFEMNIFINIFFEKEEEACEYNRIFS